MKKSYTLKFPKGVAHKVEGGKQVSVPEQPLQLCGCQFDCCHGLIELPNYNSTTGEETTYALYIVNGAVKVAPLATAITEINGYKAL
jgi:hypothetical protein